MEPDTIDNAIVKAQELGSRVLRGAQEQVTTLARLLRSIHGGEMSAEIQVPTSLVWKIRILVPLVLVYFVSPFDLIPDFIPCIGYLDDIMLLGLLWNSLSAFLDIFQHWERIHERLRQLDNQPADLPPAGAGASTAVCVVCLDQPISVMIKPCKHACLCVECGGIHLRKCPICRGNIRDTTKFFLA